MPVRTNVCVALVRFRVLSVNTAEPVIAPPIFGLKLRLKVQLEPGIRDESEAQSAGVPGPATWIKFELTLTLEIARLALPMFCAAVD